MSSAHEPTALRSLSDRIAAVKQPEQRSELLPLFAQACQAVAALHAQGETHLKLSSSCFLYDGDRLASLSAVGEPTAAYLAPEQLREESADQRTDLYSLGVVLYEVLTGRHPFIAPAHVMLVLEILTRPPAPPRTIWAGCPEHLESLCLSLLQKEKGKRPLNIEEVLSRCQAPREKLTPPKESQRTKILSAEGVYEIKEEIGRGGAGKISRAIDRRIGREIAIKESLSTSPIAIERFLREAILTAQLEHPAIVPIHETGVWSDGSPFYTMKLISGRPLSEMLGGLPLQERLSLLPRILSAAEGIAYAHAKGVIHRDLKPHNILIGDYGETIVIDWGLAKRRGAEESKEARTQRASEERDELHEKLTRVGTILGTPAYMPPEQAEGREVDERADVYSLGAILYHVLSGVSPYDTSSMDSDVFTRLRRGPPLALESLQPETPRDLCALVSKAMAREPRERYPNAREFCRDLERFVTGGLVSAHEYTLGEIIARGFKRYRSAVTVALVSLLVLAALGVYSLQQILAAKTQAEENAALAQQNEDLAKQSEATAKKERGVAIERLEQLALSQARILVESAPMKALDALRILSPGSPLWRAARIRAADVLQRGISQKLPGATGFVSDACVVNRDGLIAAVESSGGLHLWDVDANEDKLLGENDSFDLLVCAPDGRHLAASDKKNRVWLWQIQGGEPQLLFETRDVVLDMSFSHDTKALAVADQSGQVIIISLSDLTITNVLTNEQPMRSVRFSPDDRYLATVGNTPYIYIFDRSTKTRRDLASNGDFQRVRFSPDGTWLAAVSYWGDVHLWSLLSFTSKLLKGHSGEVWNLAFSPDGKTLGTVGQEKRLWLWDLSSCTHQSIAVESCGAGRPVEGHKSSIRGITFSPDGKRLVTTSMDRSVRVWNTSNWEHRMLQGHEDAVFRPAFLSDSERLLTMSWDGDLRLWDLRNGERVFAGSTIGPTSALSRDAQWAAMAYDNNSLRLTHTFTGETRTLSWDGLNNLKEKKIFLAFSSDNQRIITTVFSPGSSEMLLWDAQGNLLARDADPTRGRVYQVVFSPDDQWAAGACADGSVAIWSADGALRLVLRGEQGRSVGGVEFSPDGELLATIGSSSLSEGPNPKTLLWPVDCFARGDCKPTRSFENPRGDNGGPQFSPDGSLLAISNVEQHATTILSLKTGEQKTLPPHGEYSTHQRFSPDGKTLATIGLDTAIRLWDTSTWERRELRGHQNFVRTVAFSPDGKSLVSGGFDQTVRIWDIESGEYRVINAPDSVIMWVAYSPQGDRVTSLSNDGMVRSWADDLPNQRELFWAWLANNNEPN